MGVRNVVALAVASLALALVACTGASTAGSPQQTGAGPLSITTSNGNAVTSPLVLDDQQFIDPFSNVIYLTTALHDQRATWSVSGSSIALSQPQPMATFPGFGGGPVPTASPGDTWVTTTSTYGPSTLTVADGNTSASVTVYHFASIAFRCQFRYTPAFVFDPDRSGNINQPDSYDLYMTEPVDPNDSLNPCRNSPLSTGTAPLWHMPSGGVVIPISTFADFIAITPAQFVNPVTAISPSNAFVALLIKTKEGRYVKLTPPEGPVEVSDASGHFPY